MPTTDRKIPTPEDYKVTQADNWVGSEADIRAIDEGTSHAHTVDMNPHQKGFDPYVAGGGYDRRNYMYGRDPAAADAAALKAFQTGDAASGYGTGVSAGAWSAAQQYANRQGPQGNWAQQNASLGGASAYGNQLAGLEATQGPSAAQAQLQQGTNQAMGSQLAMARSGRGFGGGAAATGLAQGNLAGIQANQANQSSMLAAQEQAAWRGRQAQNLGNAAGINATIGAQQGQQANADLGASLTTQGQNDQTALQWAGLGTDSYYKGVGADFAGQDQANKVRGLEMQGGAAQEDNILRETAARQGWSLGAQEQKDKKEAGYIAAGASLLSMLSDARAKTDIAPAEVPITDFARAGSMVSPKQPDYAALDAAAASPGYAYRYKDPGAPGAAPGQHFGPMAQDLAKTPAGASTLQKGPDGKLAIDTGRLALVNTSAISAQQQQLDDIKRQIDAFSAQPSATYPRPSQGSF